MSREDERSAKESRRSRSLSEEGRKSSKRRKHRHESSSYRPRHHRRHRYESRSRSRSRSRSQTSRRHRSRKHRRRHRRSRSISRSRSRSRSRSHSKLRKKKRDKKSRRHRADSSISIGNQKKGRDDNQVEERRTTDQNKDQEHEVAPKEEKEKVVDELPKLAENKQKPAEIKENNDSETRSIGANAIDLDAVKANLMKALAQARNVMGNQKSGEPPQDAAALSEHPTETQNGISMLEPENDVQDDRTVQVDEPLPEKPDLSPIPATPTIIDATPPPPQAVEQVVDVEEFDMFAADAAAIVEKSASSLTAALVNQTHDATLQSNWDDADGYYRSTLGEVLNEAYQVVGNAGRGVFSTVVQCKVLKGPNLNSNVAIKLVRTNDTMRKAAVTEQRILRELASKDPENKRHIIQFFDSFEHRGHIAMVFESMQMNLREAMKKFGGKSGISLKAVRLFGKQLLISLHHLQSCGIIHADIKPDNILLNSNQTVVKLCDFGSAFKVDAPDNEPTPYLVSRFYRAPEIILGLAYDTPVDMWSIGCCLFEMFSGKILFSGGTNNEMLKCFMELRGRFSNKLIKRHRSIYVEKFQSEPHFDEENRFISKELDRVTGKPVNRILDPIKPTREINSLLMAAKSAADDRKMVMDLKDLLEKIFVLDPAKRVSVKEALSHPFIKNY